MSVWPDGTELVERKRVSSTMQEAAHLAPQTFAPTWVFAYHQEAARGRRGRPWRQGGGDFAATLLLAPGPPASEAALRSCVASLALYRALAEVTKQPDKISLKWPNDVLLAGGKVAGILLERLTSGHLCIGIGVNLDAAPRAEEVEAHALRPVSVREETGVKIAPRRFLDTLAFHFDEAERQMQSDGFAPIRCAWLARAVGLGKQIVVRSAHAQRSGRFETVDEEGHLILETDQGLARVPAGDVYF